MYPNSRKTAGAVSAAVVSVAALALLLTPKAALADPFQNTINLCTVGEEADIDVAPVGVGGSPVAGDLGTYHLARDTCSVIPQQDLIAAENAYAPPSTANPNNSGPTNGATANPPGSCGTATPPSASCNLTGFGIRASMVGDEQAPVDGGGANLGGHLPFERLTVTHREGNTFAYCTPSATTFFRDTVDVITLTWQFAGYQNRYSGSC